MKRRSLLGALPALAGISVLKSLPGADAIAHELKPGKKYLFVIEPDQDMSAAHCQDLLDYTTEVVNDLCRRLDIDADCILAPPCTNLKVYELNGDSE